MFCTACAAVNPIANRRCAACGAPLARAEQSAATGRAGRPVARRRGRRRGIERLRTLLMIALPIALLATGGGFWQADRSARADAYLRGEAALAGGHYVLAIDAFAAAGGYRDAAARRSEAEAALAPYQTAYEEGVAALAAGAEEAAIALLTPVARDLPDYRDTSVLLAGARRRREQGLLLTIEEAEERRDWLAVERSLVELVAASPDDPAPRARLAEVRHDHAPLVYSRGEALYLIGPAGEDERLVSDALPAVWPVWSPDRTRIAFISDDRGTAGNRLSLYVVATEGGEPRKLAEHLRPYAAPVWSPDGRWIAYTSEAPIPGRADPSPRSIRIVDVAGGQEIDLTGSRLPNAASPSWSPDGRRLAVVSRSDDGLPGAGLLSGGEVYIVAVATGAVANLGRNRIADPWRLAWSPAAETIVVSTRRPGMSHDADRSPLYLIDAGTEAITDLNPRLAKVSMPVWSPDGQRFAHVEDDTVVRVRGLDGEETWTSLDEAVTGSLSWSPGGEALLVAGTPGKVSFLISLGEGFGRERAVPLALDVDGRWAGPPQWSPVNPAPPPAAATTAGTARDPAPSAQPTDQPTTRQIGAQ